MEMHVRQQIEKEMRKLRKDYDDLYYKDRRRMKEIEKLEKRVIMLESIVDNKEKIKRGI